MTRARANLMLMGAAVLWSSSGLFIKLIDWAPLSILSGRSMVSAAVFVLYLGRVDFRWTRLQIVGASAYVCVQVTFIFATKLTSAANAVFLQYTAPLYILLLGYAFLGERPSRSDWVSMPLVFAGLVLFLGDGLRFSGIEGNLLGALSGLTMAVMVLCMRRQKLGVPAVTILLGNLIGIAVGFPSLIQETFDPGSLAIILFLGLFQMGLAYVLFSIAIRYLDALESSLILFLEPVLNPVWVFLVLGELPGKLALLGGLLVLGTAVGRVVRGSRTRVK